MTRKSMIAASLFAPAALFAAFAAQPAMAQVRTQAVAYNDLDLATPAGQARLDARLRRAASNVCAATVGVHPLAEEMFARRCYAKALSNARASYAVALRHETMSR